MSNTIVKIEKKHVKFPYPLGLYGPVGQPQVGGHGLNLTHMRGIHT